MTLLEIRNELVKLASPIQFRRRSWVEGRYLEPHTRQISSAAFNLIPQYKSDVYTVEDIIADDWEFMFPCEKCGKI